MILPQPPDNIDPAVKVYLQNLVRALGANQKDTMTKSQSVNQLLVSSPDKSVFSIQVDDAGTLVTTKVAGG